MKRNTALVASLMFLILGGMTCLAASLNQLAQYRLTANSFGPLRVGMSVNQAAAALKLPLTGADASNAKLRVDPECSYVWPKGHSAHALRFMRRHNRIVRIDMGSHAVYSSDSLPVYKTALGAYVGMSEKDLKALYKHRKPLLMRAHKYTSHSREYIADPGKPMEIHFETNGKKITAIRAGRAEEVNWVEECG